MNPNTRTECIEALFSQSEFVAFDVHCKTVGVPRSTLLRWLANREVNGSGSPRQTESLPRRGAPFASRASAGRASSRGHGGVKCPGKGGAGGSHRVLQV